MAALVASTVSVGLHSSAIPVQRQQLLLQLQRGMGSKLLPTPQGSPSLPSTKHCPAPCL